MRALRRSMFSIATIGAVCARPLSGVCLARAASDRPQGSLASPALRESGNV